MRSNFSKSEKRKLKALAELAYEKQLIELLNETSESVDKWKNGEIDPFQLQNIICKVHSKKSKELDECFNSLEPDLYIAKSISSNILDEKELPEELKERILQVVNFFNRI